MRNKKMTGENYGNTKLLSRGGKSVRTPFNHFINSLERRTLPMSPMMQWMSLLVPALLVGGVVRAAEHNGQLTLSKVAIGNNIELNYTERGKGIPVIFVHGTLGDYSVWEGQLNAFSVSYRALA